MQYSLVAFFAGLAAAYHAPVGAPTGNAITAPLVQTIPAGKPFTINWIADSPNKVSLLLLKGPSTNAVFNQVIVESIPNSGTFTWTPPTSLEGTDGPGGYGIQLIDDVDGHYQYSTQFGISNEKPVSSAAPVSTPAPVSSVAPVSSAYESSAVAPKPTVSAGYAVSSSAVEVPSSTEEVSSDCTTTTTVYAPAPPVGTGASIGAPPPGVIYPTGQVTVPASLKTTGTGAVTGGYYVPTSTPALEFTGAASSFKAGLGLAGAVAAFIAML
ncbi:hypothetical protein P171DRAFT_435865 [Karstenula rhodostoma CBS 690.94]|uniref:Yeast cell wall synthesis Kre9/Knh1-like N-terminal domain-containing protein n=1 Tax=Karstenula rhodostoma CBS 690.94 TaxID=1392251 RepID=A0A9P4U7D2_9PLEO|nr:hypothetical protein P171DRAFT_435865 [Karstenula rhodostoma CBS 690.94]